MDLSGIGQHDGLDEFVALDLSDSLLGGLPRRPKTANYQRHGIFGGDSGGGRSSTWHTTVTIVAGCNGHIGRVGGRTGQKQVFKYTIAFVADKHCCHDAQGTRTPPYRASPF
jgi:hypothetical protein